MYLHRIFHENFVTYMTMIWIEDSYWLEVDSFQVSVKLVTQSCRTEVIEFLWWTVEGLRMWESFLVQVPCG